MLLVGVNLRSKLLFRLPANSRRFELSVEFVKREALINLGGQLIHWGGEEGVDLGQLLGCAACVAGESIGGGSGGSSLIEEPLRLAQKVQFLSGRGLEFAVLLQGR